MALRGGFRSLGFPISFELKGQPISLIGSPGREQSPAFHASGSIGPADLVFLCSARAWRLLMIPWQNRDKRERPIAQFSRTQPGGAVTLRWNPHPPR
jgi:hypothetical protein